MNTSSEQPNIVPVSPEKMQIIRTLACAGITDKMIHVAAQKAWDYAQENPEEVDNFCSMVELGMRYLLLGASSGNSQN